MKRLCCLMFTLLLLLPVLIVTSSASETSLDVVHFEDGSYLTIQLIESNMRAGGTKTANKTYTYTENDGTVAWKAVLNGSFSYTGSSAVCTSSICSVTIYDTAWYQVSKTTSKNGATATAELTMGYKLLGITMKKVPVNMTLTCDPNGNLS